MKIAGGQEINTLFTSTHW